MKIAFVLACTSTLVACAAYESSASATAFMNPTKESSVSGKVTFRQKSNHVLVEVEVIGLTPYSEHGFHVHDRGDCSSGDGMSAGGHFNPNQQPHGAHTSTQHHMGDLPSLSADAKGEVRLSFENASISLLDGTSKIIGRSLIIHSDPDDFQTQPTGNSGPRLSCGLIVKN